MSHVFLQARNTPQRRDCLAGVGGLELRNVVAKYPFARSHRFPGSYIRCSNFVRIAAISSLNFRRHFLSRARTSSVVVRIRRTFHAQLVRHARSSPAGLPPHHARNVVRPPPSQFSPEAEASARQYGPKDAATWSLTFR